MNISTFLRQTIFGLVITLVVFYLAYKSQGVQMEDLYRISRAYKLHAPDFSILAKQSLAVQVHILAVVAALCVGLIQIFGPKGTTIHRILGWSWVIFMGAVAVSSIFIRELNNGQFSFIHIFTVLTLINLPILVYAAKKKDIKRHSSTAIGVFVGALLIAGVFAFMPGRLMWHVFFG